MDSQYKKIKRTIIAALMVSALAFPYNTFAQAIKNKAAQNVIPQAAQQAPTIDFSDAEIKQFADANNRLMAVQQEGEKVMLSILKEEKVEVEKFNVFAKAYQEQKLEEIEATPEELAALNKVAQRIIELQPTIQQDVEKAIVKDGMTLEKYEQIMLAYQNSPALQQKVHKMME